MIADDRTGSRGEPEEPARPEPREADAADPGPGRAASGGAAHTAEPVGDHDAAVEAEHTDAAVEAEHTDAAVEAEHTDAADRVRDLDAVSDDDAAPAAPDGDGVGGDPLAQVEAQRDEYLALAQRAQADFDNYRKRAARDVAAAGARAKAELVRAMLPVVDNLERALDSAGQGEAGLAEGVRLVHSELVGALERNGVAGIEAAGERFDPNVHEALSTRPDNGTEPGVVLDVVQKGYRLDGTVLRPARVVVAA